MDSGDDCRSLPGRVGMPKWMKRTDKQDFIDMCASPPTDGFFHANPRMNKEQITAIGGCVQREYEQEKNEMGQNLPKFADIKADTDQIACINSQGKGFYNSYQSEIISEKSGDHERSVTKTTTVLKMNSHELEKWAKDNIHGREVLSADDSAPTPVDNLNVIRQSNPLITKTEEGGTLRLIDKLGTPDVTPCTTPAITPNCSPQVPRRSENPFFSGEMNRTEGSGSWLFRPGPKQSTTNILYEAKVDIKQGDNSQTTTKTVRYVPRPSNLRELNFWSPTSM